MTAVRPLPVGTRIAFDRRTRRIDHATWSGGSPIRVLRLTDAAVGILPELSDGIVRTRRGGLLARTFTDAGLAHPRPVVGVGATSCAYTVVIPVKDRPAQLGRCLDALRGTGRVVVIDDGSTEPDVVADVVCGAGAQLVTRDINGGPAAARNTGLLHVTSEIVVFVDSDTLPTRESIDALCEHFADPLVGAVAPRILPVPSTGVVNRYLQARSSLDMGPDEARVAPGTRVPYVPTAVLAVRRTALDSLEVGSGAFDETMRFGEDVDLVWRLHANGWRVRYDPSVVVRHEDPLTWTTLLVRKYRYGTSAGPLAQRHGAAVAPLALPPLHAATLTAALARKPALVFVGMCALVSQSRQSLRRAGMPTDDAHRRAGSGLGRASVATGRWAVQVGGPGLVVGIVSALVPGSGSARRSRAAVMAVLALLPALATWRERRPPLDPVRFGLAYVAEECAYGLGLWRGSVAARSPSALVPRLVFFPSTLTARRRRASRSISVTTPTSEVPR